ncbi:DUF3575 domain-containing protein [Chitinophaga sp.]|uniref:DUF3575 domain-containing protein n=1 Tax=Chitinophaga sp. TaxID=1869181 RepID=UPI002639571D|nr:DUF3575 domain-containing protein [uncultured Chitinophaga sp.]
MKHAALTFAFALCLSTAATAQQTAPLEIDTEIAEKPPRKERLRNQPMYSNIVKTNLSSLALNNYSLTYERLLTRKISASLGYRYMPKSALTKSMLGETVMDYVKEDGDDDLQNQLDKLQMSGGALTAEFRFYTGRRPGAKGFYAGIYGRYSNFKYDYPYDYEKPDQTTTLVPLKGNSSGFGGGVVMGGQFMIAKRVVVDLYIIGAHYGKMTGKVDGITDLSDLDEQERTDLKNELEDLVDLGGSEKNITAEVRDDGIRADIRMPFLGVRGLGLTVGFAF